MKDQTENERPRPAPPATSTSDSPQESPAEQYLNGDIDLDEYARRVEEQADEIARRDLAPDEEEEIEAVG
jgi:hypothetical protein